MHPLKQIYGKGLKNILTSAHSDHVINKLLPALDDLLALHKKFVKNLVGAQKNNVDRRVEKIGLVLYNHVSVFVLFMV